MALRWGWTARGLGSLTDIYLREGGSGNFSEVHCSDYQQCWRVEEGGPDFLGPHLCSGMPSCAPLDSLGPWLL